MIYLQTLMDGIMLGGVYGTIAMGLSLAFGVMGIINWAHGEFLMVSMFISYLLVSRLGMDPYLTVLFNIIILFCLGYLIQKYIFSNLLKRDKAREPISVLLSTAGLGMILWNLATLIFGSNALFTQSSYTGKTIWIGDAIMISIPRLISFVIAIVISLVLFYFLQKTEHGRALRATSQNREVASLMGININNAYCVAFGLSLAMVGVAGALLVPSYSVYPKIGEIYSNKAFIIVVLGGKGNVRGALLGGFIIGLIERFGAIFLTESYGVLLTFALFVVILLLKPNGLFEKSTR